MNGQIVPCKNELNKCNILKWLFITSSLILIVERLIIWLHINSISLVLITTIIKLNRIIGREFVSNTDCLECVGLRRKPKDKPE